MVLESGSTPVCSFHEIPAADPVVVPMGACCMGRAVAVFPTSPSPARIRSPPPPGMKSLRVAATPFDAAVAVAAALAVVEPHGSGLGGGGFWLLHRIDGWLRDDGGRTRGAPLAATEKMYLDAAGNPVPRRSLDGALAAAIPSTPAALAHVAKNTAGCRWRHRLRPPFAMPARGLPSPAYRKWITHRVAALRASSAAARVFLDRQELPALGHVVRQPELAGVLTRLGADGARDFYQGDTARLLVAGVRAAGGFGHTRTWRSTACSNARRCARAIPACTYGRGAAVLRGRGVGADARNIGRFSTSTGSTVWRVSKRSSAPCVWRTATARAISAIRITCAWTLSVY